MSSWNCGREQERLKREAYLQQRVQETLRLSPSDLPTQACATYTPSSEEQKTTARQYKNKLRTIRILQVKAQESLLAAQRVSQFRDRKQQESRVVLNYLKGVWRNDQRQYIASLEEEFAKSCRSIGASHEAAQLVVSNKAAKEKLAAIQAEESRCWDALRFEEAIHKERELKEKREMNEECAPASRRKIGQVVSNVERSFASRYNRGTKPKAHEKQAYGCSQTMNPLPKHDATGEKLHSRLAGCAVDFKDIHLHSRFVVQHCPSPRCHSTGVRCSQQQQKFDAWRAADARRESMKTEKEHQIELDTLLRERQLERGNAAIAKQLNDQRIAMLEHEVGEAFRREERKKEHVRAVAIPGFFCTRPASTDQQRRVLYTKHNISNPLSCPGLPHTSRTCSKCRSSVELIPRPPTLGNEEANAEFNNEYEPDAVPEVIMPV